MHKQILSVAAIGLTFVMFWPYIRAIRRGEIKPHVFSWIIWTLGTLIVFFAQLADGAGVGAWPIGISGAVTGYIALLAYLKRSDSSITSVDWMFFITALSALPFWFLTSDPLWTVVILTTVDLVGFGPTLRKAYVLPYEEGIVFFGLAAARNVLVILALQHYSLTTVLFPAAVGLACLVFVATVAYRRRVLTGEQAL